MITMKHLSLGIFGLAISLLQPSSASAVPCYGIEQPLCRYDDFPFFVLDVHPLRTIDFETLPDGSPSYSGYDLTTQQNYTNRGATFSVDAGLLNLGGGGPGYQFDLVARTTFEPGQPPATIIVDLVVPTTAVGVQFPGGTILSAYDASDNLIMSISSSTPSEFLGIASDTLIARAAIGGIGDVEEIRSFHFNPTPEPSAAMLLGAMTFLSLFQRRRAPRT